MWLRRWRLALSSQWRSARAARAKWRRLHRKLQARRSEETQRLGSVLSLIGRMNSIKSSLLFRLQSYRFILPCGGRVKFAKLLKRFNGICACMNCFTVHWRCHKQFYWSRIVFLHFHPALHSWIKANKCVMMQSSVCQLKFSSVDVSWTARTVNSIQMDMAVTAWAAVTIPVISINTISFNSSEWDMEIWWPEVEHVTRGRSCDMFNRGSSYFHVALATVHHVLSSDQLQESWIIRKLKSFLKRIFMTKIA